MQFTRRLCGKLIFILSNYITVIIVSPSCCLCKIYVIFSRQCSTDMTVWAILLKYLKTAELYADMNMMPCSFANQDPSWFMNLNEYSIEEVWNSKLFDKFRYSLKHSCKGCKNREFCSGGCPLVNQITLCNRECRDFQKGE